MNKCLSTVVLCLSALTASAGTMTHSPSIAAAFSDPAGMALHILAMSPDEQHDLALWTASQDGARDLPLLWDGPVASVSSAPVRPSSDNVAAAASTAHVFSTPAPDPLAFLMLSAALSACSYTLRRTRLSGPAACG